MVVVTVSCRVLVLVITFADDEVARSARAISPDVEMEERIVFVVIVEVGAERLMKQQL